VWKAQDRQGNMERVLGCQGRCAVCACEGQLAGVRGVVGKAFLPRCAAEGKNEGAGKGGVRWGVVVRRGR